MIDPWRNHPSRRWDWYFHDFPIVPVNCASCEVRKNLQNEVERLRLEWAILRAALQAINKATSNDARILFSYYLEIELAADAKEFEELLAAPREAGGA